MALITGKKANSYALPRSRTVMRITLIISLLFHGGLLMGFQKAFPINWMMEPLRTYRVELIRPPMDPVDDQETGGADLARVKPEEDETPEKAEDTISLDTTDERYVSYARVIKERLMRNWTYPREARENLMEGKVLVLFTLNRQGNLNSIRILEPAAFEILDRETMKTIRTAAPFPPFPGSVTVKRLNIKANFAYRLTTRKQRGKNPSPSDTASQGE